MPCSRFLTVISICLIGLAGNPAAAANPGEGDVKAAACILETGDLNGDRIVDYAVSWPQRPGKPAATVYILYGSGSAPPEGIDEGTIRRDSAVILHGSAAVPFSCSQSAEKITPRAGTSRQLNVSATLPATEIGAPIRYKLVDLDPGGWGRIYGQAISPAGHVVGACYTADREEHACLFDGDGVHDLGTLGGHYSVAYDINTDGQVCGYSLTGEFDAMGYVHQAFLSDGFTLQGLGEAWSSAAAINDKTQVAGAMQIAPGFYHAALFENGTATDLGALDGPYSFAHGINNHGQIVGAADTYTAESGQSATHSVLFEQGKVHDLGSMGYRCLSEEDEGVLKIDCLEYSVANDINDLGQIAGHSTIFNGSSHAYLMENGVATDLGTLGGAQSWAMAVNNSGQVVGISLNQDDNEYRAFLYERGIMYDLNDLIIDSPPIPPMWSAQDINDFGQITGNHYRLDPIYPTIDNENEFSFEVTLGRQFDFSYWIEEAEPGTCSRKAHTQVMIKIELDEPVPSATRRKLARWRPASGSKRCEDSSTWLPAALTLPKAVFGKQATIHIRTRASGPDWNPTLYLRHFDML